MKLIGGIHYRQIQIYIFVIFITSFLDAAAQKDKYLLLHSVGYYETLNYPKAYLEYGHSRVRRSLNPREELNLDFHSHNRHFDLILKRDVSIFSDGLKYDTSTSFHPSNVYEGTLRGDPNSRVHGFIHDGIFEGRIHCGDGSEFHVESAKQYKHLNTSEFHSVIYNAEDVIHPKTHMCGAAVAGHHGWMERQRNTSDYVSFQTSKMNYDDTLMRPEVHHRQRRAFDNAKKECRLYVRADYTFVNHAGDEGRAMLLITQYVKSVSHIYSETDFNSDGTPEKISLNIKRISVIPKSDYSKCGEGDCQFSNPYIGVEKFLDLASLDNHNDYCLAYVFAHRDFADGVLGLAWIGDTTGAGGICDEYQAISGGKKSLNTGIVTNLNYGNTMANKVVEITLAHEIGHNFGSKHDPLSGECAPGGISGNYIMYPRATSGTENNNHLFSKCSKGYIWPVLEAKSSRCFSKPDEPICGNRIKEKGEECDCGYKDEDSCKKDLCCNPSDPDSSNQNGCKFSSKANGVTDVSKRCSSSSGLCCDIDNCQPYNTPNKHLCLQKTDCMEASFCDPSSYKCPNGNKRDNMTTCRNDTKVCISGECTGSICLKDGMVECQCTEEKNYCKICCQNGNITSSCTPHTGSKNLPSGSPCDNYAGYCDFLSKCRKVDAEGPLSRLKNWLFNPKTFNNILDWMKTYWWACVLIGLGLVLFMAAFIACCSVHTPSSNPNKPPPRHLSMPRTLSRRNRGANPSAPPAGYGSSGYQRHDGQQGYSDSGPPGYDTATRDTPRYEMR